MNAFFWIFLLLAGLVQWPAAHAAPASAAASTQQPSVKLSLFKVVAQGGKEQLQSASAIAPGDVVEYQAAYLNPTSDTARNVQVTLPVPEGGLEPLLSTFGPQAVQASLDGKKFEPIPLTRVQTLAQGTQTKSLVPASEYRFLRWTLGDMPAGASRTVSARMQLPVAATSVAATGSSTLAATPAR